MIVITFNSQIQTPNKFKRDHQQQIEKYGSFIQGLFYLTSPKINEFISLCASLGYDIKFVNDTASVERTNRFVNTYYTNNLFYVKFNTVYPPKITETESWKKLVSDTPSRCVYTFYFYTFLKAHEILLEEGYEFNYDDIISDIFSNNEEDVLSELTVKPMPLGNWAPLPHQIQSADKIKEWNGRGIIADEAGLGKTVSAVLSLINLYDSMTYKRGIWVVPTVPLVFQITEELYSRFGIRATPITQKIKRAERIGDGQTSIYERESVCVMTWASFRNDWTKNLSNLLNVRFGFAVFDEIHQAKFGSKTFEAIMNFPADIRIGLTGTPLPNGKWEELYNIIYVTNPLLLPTLSYYTQQKIKIQRKIEKNRTDNESVERKTDRMMNKITNNALSSKIIRHTRKEVETSLPVINEIQPFHVDLEHMENLILDSLFLILEEIISDWLSDRNNHVIEYAKSMIWQDIRRFCAYGGKNIHNRVRSMLTEKKAVYNYIQKHYRKQLQQINKMLGQCPVTEYPKFPKLLQSLKQIPNHHVLLFCDSVLTCIDMAEYLHDNGFNCKVITGGLNLKNEGSDESFIDENADVQNTEKERVRSIFEKLNQNGKMDDVETQDNIDWLWSPYSYITNLASKITSGSVSYSIDGKEDVGVCYYVTLKQAETVAIKITNYDRLTNGELNYIDFIKTEIGEIDSNFVSDVKNNEIVIMFRNGERKDSRILITTNKLAEGCNLQIAQTVVFFDYPLSIKNREQRLARIHRMGSPYKEIYLVSIICGIEYAVKKTLGEKYSSTGEMEFSDTVDVSMMEIIKKIRADRRR